MRPDERLLARECYLRLGAFNLKRSITSDACPGDFAIKLGIGFNRTRCILARWYIKGWFDYDYVEELGWLTPDGEQEFSWAGRKVLRLQLVV